MLQGVNGNTKITRENKNTFGGGSRSPGDRNPKEIGRFTALVSQVIHQGESQRITSPEIAILKN